MRNKRVALVLSVILSIAAHAALIVLAPRIVMLHRHPDPEALRRVQLDVIDDDYEPPRTAYDAAPPSLDYEPAIGGPGEMPGDAPPPLDDIMRDPADVAPRPDGLAADPPDPEPLADPDPDLLARLDTELIAIGQDAVREDIDVERRPIEADAPRVLPEDVFPGLRGPGAIADDLLFFEARPLASARGGAPDWDDDIIADPPALPLGDDGMDLRAPTEGLPDLPEDAILSRRPLADDLAADLGDFDFIDDLVAIQVDSYIPDDEPEGYFRIAMFPRGEGGLDPLPKDIVFVVDASRSIQQRKMNDIARALQDALRRLRPEDRFNVVLFRDTPQAFRDHLVTAAPENVEAAIAYLQGVETGGSTDIYAAMHEVLTTSTRSGMPGVVVMVSDGFPTRGVVDGRTLVNELSARNYEDLTIFSFAGGRAIDRYLLDLLAYRNRGESVIAPTLGDVSVEFRRFLDTLRDPLMVDLQADFGRIDGNRVFPRQLPDFYRDRPVIMYGRFDPQRTPELTMRLTGGAAGDKKEVVVRADLLEAAREEPAIARQWGFRKVYHLIGEIVREGERPELIAELRAVSRRYGIRTSYDN